MRSAWTARPPETIVPGAGDPTAGTTFDPIAGGGACASTGGADQAGVANYRLPAAPSGGFTLMGSPTIVADLESPGPGSELAARLVDVRPGGHRDARRPWPLPPGVGKASAVLQLHPQGYHFDTGHVAKLELLPADPPYARPSNAQLPVTVSDLQLRLPVIQPPGSLGNLVQQPAPKVVPPGYELAAEYPHGRPASGASVRAGAVKSAAAYPCLGRPRSAFAPPAGT